MGIVCQLGFFFIFRVLRRNLSDRVHLFGLKKSCYRKALISSLIESQKIDVFCVIIKNVSSVLTKEKQLNL